MSAIEETKSWVGDIMAHPIVKICAVFFAAAIFIKGCDVLEGKDKGQSFQGDVPDCTNSTQNDILIDKKAYVLACK